ncbi:MAG: S1C family serine protease [bacterium]|nr:S1C family serine protease [bacterium]
MKAVIISLCIGFVGGVLGAALFITFFPIYSQQPQPLPITVARAGATVEFQTDQALESIISFIQPNAKDRFSSSQDAIGAAVALTADGLMISSTTVKNLSGLKGVAHDGSSFALTASFGKNVTPIMLADTGFALLKAANQKESPRLKPATLSAFEDLKVGQSVFSIDAKKQIAWHHISALRLPASSKQPISSEDPRGGFFIVTAAPQEGSFLFNAEGQLVGIAMKNGEVAPAEWIATAVRQFLKEGSFRPVTLGIYFLDVNHLIALAPSTDSTGLLIEGDKIHRAISPGFPAFKAGLRAGDRITAFDGRRLDGTVPFSLLLGRYSPGTEVEVVFMREGKEEKVNVVLGTK